MPDAMEMPVGAVSAKTVDQLATGSAVSFSQFG